jgi:hypothetical protein
MASEFLPRADSKRPGKLDASMNKRGGRRRGYKNHLVNLDRPDRVNGVPLVLSVIDPWTHKGDVLPDWRDRDGSLVPGNQLQDYRTVLVFQVASVEELGVPRVETDIDPLVTIVLAGNGFHDPARHLAI